VTTQPKRNLKRIVGYASDDERDLIHKAVRPRESVSEFIVTAAKQKAQRRLQEDDTK